MSKLAVYTLAVGGKYGLHRPPADDSCTFICFTDQSDIEPNGWEIKQVSLLLKADPFRSSREFKICAHRFLSEFDRSLYVDSTVKLLQPPSGFWRFLIPSEEHVFGGFYHFKRPNTAKEFRVVRNLRLDHPELVAEQLATYQVTHPEVLEQRPVWGGALARRHMHHECVRAMELWFAHVLRYARRDQLSLPVALSYLPDSSKNLIETNQKVSRFHKWPVSLTDRPPGYDIRTASLDDRLARAGKARCETAFPKGDELDKKLANSTTENVGIKLPRETNKVLFGYDEDAGLYFVFDKARNRRLYVAHRKRLDLYRRGCENRQSRLISEYRLGAQMLNAGDQVVDIGANIGEIGIWAKDLGASYLAIEPDPSAFSALTRNVPDGILCDVALSDKEGEADFFLDTANADSNLFESVGAGEKLRVQVTTLDQLLAENYPDGPIKILKVEAEGMEPEILSGAKITLDRCDYVAVDAGPERGGQNTVPGVCNCLFRAGFELLDCHLRRGTFLFKKIAQ